MANNADISGPGIERAHSIVHSKSSGYWMTDLTKTTLEDVRSRYFRLFTPVKLIRKRIPTSLPEFWSIRHDVTLSDSPVTAAAKLGGHWSDHNHAAITHVGACNFRCKYCYVSFRHLAGHDGFPGDAKSLVEDFVRIRSELADAGRPLTILRVSGGEPLLAPGLVAEVYQQLDRRNLLGQSVLKVESNLSARLRATLVHCPTRMGNLTIEAKPICVRRLVR
jgi:sulfatase maturation enzyme AslB (radical SAM superfamily)